jgi:hypothetical protein
MVPLTARLHAGYPNFHRAGFEDQQCGVDTKVSESGSKITESESDSGRSCSLRSGRAQELKNAFSWVTPGVVVGLSGRILGNLRLGAGFSWAMMLRLTKSLGLTSVCMPTLPV